MTNLFVLISRYCYKYGLVKYISVEGVPTHRKYIVCLYYVNTRLILVHRVQNYLEIKDKIFIIIIIIIIITAKTSQSIVFSAQNNKQHPVIRSRVRRAI